MAWKREKGSARGYVNTETGARISYRQYRALYVASANYRPLDVPRLAKARSKQAQYRDLVAARLKLEQSRRLSAIREANLSPAQIDAVERGAARVSKSGIMKSSQFKADIARLKQLSKIKTDDRTKAQTRELVDVLKRLDENRGTAAEDKYLRRARIRKPPSRPQQFRRAA
jgi:hypothetical protein